MCLCKCVSILRPQHAASDGTKGLTCCLPLTACALSAKPRLVLSPQVVPAVLAFHPQYGGLLCMASYPQRKKARSQPLLQHWESLLQWFPDATQFRPAGTP